MDPAEATAEPWLKVSECNHIVREKRLTLELATVELEMVTWLVLVRVEVSTVVDVDGTAPEEAVMAPAVLLLDGAPYGGGTRAELELDADCAPTALEEELEDATEEV